MRNIELARIFRLACCFLTLNLLLLTISFVAKGQSRTASPNLAGTVWTTEPIVIPGTNGVTLMHFYQFANNGKVARVILVTRPPGVKFNPFTQKLDLTTGIDGVFSDAGTYKQTGNSIRLEFSEQNQGGMIAGDKMWGNIEGGKIGNLTFVAKKVYTHTEEWRELNLSAVLGTWEGTVDQVPCSLQIDRIEGDAFHGILNIAGGRIAVTGGIDPNARRIAFVESRVISLGSLSNWTFGSNQGFISNNGRMILGGGDRGGHIYSWRFSKK